MMTDTALALTPKDVAAISTEVDPQAVEAFVNALSPEEVALFLIRAEAAKRLVARAAKLAEARLIADGLTGLTVTDGDRRYEFRPDRKREVPDLAGLLTALEARGVTIRRLAEFLGHDAVRITPLKAAGFGDLLDEFSAWVNTPPKLLEVDEKGRPLRR